MEPLIFIGGTETERERKREREMTFRSIFFQVVETEPFNLFQKIFQGYL